MFSITFKSITICFLVFAATTGCKMNERLSTSFAPNAALPPTLAGSYLELAEPDLAPVEPDATLQSASPVQTIDYHNVQYQSISLEECIRVALQSSEVFRDLSGTIISSPTGIATSIDPALRFTDPRFGEDAALSAFDANFIGSVNAAKNDRPFNNRFSGNSNGLFVQDLAQYSFELNKLSASGTTFNTRTGINYDGNNQAGNRYLHSWEALVEGGFRHPFLQGSGSTFNRIAGPSRVPGTYNGILIARTNTEISMSTFDASVRDFISNIENAYWDLYFAYRELDAQIDSRDAAAAVLKNTEAQATEQKISGLTLAGAKEQYLRFESAIIESLEGRPIEGTQSRSGSSGGTFRRTVGVRVAERRLRFLIGMSITDGQLLQPSEQPLKAPITFDWDDSVASATTMRPEARRQRWVIKQKELELTAAKNFLLPRLDLVGNYRFRGLGKDLTGSGTLNSDINNSGLLPFTGNSAAVGDLFSGDYQEIQLGAELSMPVGFRRAHAGVRNAELSVQREKTIMKEQERKILLDLSNAVAEARRAHSAMSLAEKRFSAALDYRRLATEAFTLGRSQVDVVLEAQRRVLESQLQFINAEVEYALAIKNVHYEKGTILEYNGIALAESESSSQAYLDFDRRVATRKKEMSYVKRDVTVARPQPMVLKNQTVLSESTAAAPQNSQSTEIVTKGPSTLAPPINTTGGQSLQPGFIVTDPVMSGRASMLDQVVSESPGTVPVNQQTPASNVIRQMDAVPKKIQSGEPLTPSLPNSLQPFLEIPAASTRRSGPMNFRIADTQPIEVRQAASSSAGPVKTPVSTSNWLELSDRKPEAMPVSTDQPIRRPIDISNPVEMPARRLTEGRRPIDMTFRPATYSFGSVVLGDTVETSAKKLATDGQSSNQSSHEFRFADGATSEVQASPRR